MTGQQMTRRQWRAEWRAGEHEGAIREALAQGDPLEALARACAAVRSEATKRSPRAAALIATRLAAVLLHTANGIPGLTPPGPRGDLTPTQLAAVFDRALEAAARDQERQV